MFSPALGRAVRSTSSFTPPTLGRVACAATQQTLSSPSCRPTHQRRLSSSKASIPPNGENGEGSQQQTASQGPAKVVGTRKVARTSKKKSVQAQTLNVPHVPPTDHLQKPDVKISAFFSLHRPISVTTAIPPVSTISTFDSIFQSRDPHSRKTMADNIQTLSGGIESLEAALRGHDQKGSEDIVEDVVNLDGPPQVSMDKLMSRFVPFRPPPAPMPLGQEGEPEQFSSQHEAAPVASVTRRSWSTEVVVTESIDAVGKRTYSATTAPMVEIQEPGKENSRDIDQVEIRQPFLERMRQRQNTHTRFRDTQRPDMLAISVKRQRKLKMKKHKYKKLMKRTRLLRRKLDRA